ncbi:MAG: cytochrome c3 family protein [SAR202 cluster bacterium]|nr:cytochrome c3 family protein [Chloroflexota bacterium]MEE3167366.1 cytochrome c3 family protein [Chloroflexota bacterium]MQG63433.1 cytochrome c3 family protein [SAR202 cluster bacterium]
MPSRKMLPLMVAGGVATVIMGFVVVVLLISWFSNPPFGLGNAPDQPIAFPHTVHVAENNIQCEFCHRNVTKGAAATVPAVETCLFCHKDIDGGTVTAQEEINKVRTAFETDTPINWERVHRLPDHVRFIHEAHIRYFTDETIGVKYGINGEELTESPDVAQTCTICHGDVANKEVVQPKTGQSLKMGTCVDCHRVNSISTDCTICHK